MPARRCSRAGRWLPQSRESMRRSAMPASPAETATSKATPRPWSVVPFAGNCARGPGITSAEGDVVQTCCSDCLGDDPRLTPENAALIVEAVNAYDALKAATCPKPSLHQVEGAQIQKLADLLRTATALDEI